jgi:hypothetical protein
MWQGAREGPMNRRNGRRHVAMGAIVTAISGAMLANPGRALITGRWKDVEHCKNSEPDDANFSGDD